MINKHSKLRKGPLVFTTALLFFAPICMAQSALASTSSFEKQSLGTLGTQPQSGLKYPAGNFLGQKPRTILSSETPSLADINTLESSLTQAESQVAQLLNSPAKNPALQATINTKIQNLKTRIANLKEAITQAKKDYADYQKAATTLSEALAKLNSATSNKEAAQEAYNTALKQQQDALVKKEAAEAARAIALENLQEVVSVRTEKEAITNAKSSSRDAAASNKSSKEIALATRVSQLAAANAALAQAEADYNLALEVKNSAQLTLNEAQSNYDNNLIPDPTWIQPTYQQEHTRLVPHTEIVEVVTPTSHIETIEHVTQVPVYTEVPTTTLIPHTTLVATGGVLAEVFNRNGYNNAPPLPYAGETPIYTEIVSTIDFNWGGGQVLNSGRSEDVIVRFSGNLLVPEDGYYQFYTPADDGTKLDIAGMSVINDWYDKGGGGTISEPVYIRAGIFYPFTLHYYENGGGANVWMYTYTPNGGFQIVPATWMGSGAQQITTYEEVTTWETVTTYEDVITYEDITVWEDVITYKEVTTFTEEIYYTTELVQSEGTIQVAINEGGSATFTAPEGTKFTGSNLRYEAKDRPECGTNIYPQVNGLTQITLEASNGVHGDPCGGWYKHIVGILSYSGTPTAPLINDPSLKPALDTAQEVFQTAADNFSLVEGSLSTIQFAQNSANSDYETADSELVVATEELDVAQAQYEVALVELATIDTEKAVVETKVAEAETDFTLATTTATEAEAVAVEKVTELSTAEAASISATTTFNEAEVAHTSAATSYQTSVLKATTTSTELPTETEYREVTTLIEEPVPTPPVEEGSKEIPAELSAKNLMEVNLEAVDPTELTVAQAEQLKEAALETFLTAEVGSPEYEQALDALYLAAEQDDIELSPELAAIPGLAAAAELVNFLGNAGADMSPKVREESKKVVVTAVVAAGAAIQSAAAAASTASAGASGSGGSRRTGKQ